MKGMAFSTLATLALTIFVMTIVIVFVVTQFIATSKDVDDIRDTVGDSISETDKVQSFALCQAQAGNCLEDCGETSWPKGPCPEGYYCCK